MAEASAVEEADAFVVGLTVAGVLDEEAGAAAWLESGAGDVGTGSAVQPAQARASPRAAAVPFNPRGQSLLEESDPATASHPPAETQPSNTR